MLTSAVVKIIDLCTRYAWQVVVAAMVLTVLSGTYAVRNFAINSDINAMLSPDLEWRQRERAFEAVFPRFEIIIAVVNAPTPEQTEAATAALAAKLSQNKDRFKSVTHAGGGEFFQRNGLLFLPPDELKNSLDGLVKAEPMIRDLASDPSLRGLTSAIDNALHGVRTKHIALDQLATPFNTVSDTLDRIIAGEPASFSWRLLAQNRSAEPKDLRGFIEIRPVLDYHALEPGHAAIKAIRDAGAEVLPQYQARVRLTGPVPMADEEFATLKENAEINGILTIAVVLFILWLALRSKRLILAVAINLFVGLSLTAAFGLWLVGAFNLISVSFAVLFVGIGVDFGIQHAVRYRHERHEFDNLRGAIHNAGKYVGSPLTLAAAATAAGFLSFLPTHYRGISELGLISGSGMLIAFLSTITLLPAMIRLLNPPGEPEPLGYASLAPVDSFMERNRIPIIIGTAVCVIGAMPLLYWLQFDFNPVNLRSPKVESVATYLELNRDPDARTNTVSVLSPSLKDADATADRLRKLPEVSQVMTASSLVPDQQDQKLQMIREAQKVLEPAVHPKEPMEAPSDKEEIEYVQGTAELLTKFAGTQTSPGAEASRRLAKALTAVAEGSQELRNKVKGVFLPPLRQTLEGLSSALNAQPVTPDSLPADLRREWVGPDGQARVSATPSGDPTNNDEMRNFARAVLAVEPNATEGSISVLEAGNTIVRAFFEAGFWALLSIGIILWIVLRRFTDVLLTLVPLVLAAVVTLQLCVIVGMPLNFANIIALPLLLGVGVAFKIYYIMAWRSGQTNLLQTSLTRAVFYSALATATAFASLCFSSHPGTSSMGQLLAMSLICTLAAAVLFQPVLMGRPREVTAGGPSPDDGSVPVPAGPAVSNPKARLASAQLSGPAEPEAGGLPDASRPDTAVSTTRDIDSGDAEVKSAMKPAAQSSARGSRAGANRRAKASPQRKR